MRLLCLQHCWGGKEEEKIKLLWPQLISPFHLVLTKWVRKGNLESAGLLSFPWLTKSMDAELCTLQTQCSGFSPIHWTPKRCSAGNLHAELLGRGREKKGRGRFQITSSSLLGALWAMAAFFSSLPPGEVEENGLPILFQCALCKSKEDWSPQRNGKWTGRQIA